MGAGDDTFQWNPGDGSDTVEGQDGNDKMLFFGSNASENIDISANGSRVRFFRDVGNVTMDLNGIERIEFRTLGGADNIVVNDLTGTDLTQIELGLRGPNGGPDGEADTITVNGTQGADNFGVAGDIGGPPGLRPLDHDHHLRPGSDPRPTHAQRPGRKRHHRRPVACGPTRFSSPSTAATATTLLTGSDGNDLINGGRGNDMALMGAGDDTFVWNPGDGSDIVEGQDGNDTMLFNGANVNENIDISANGQRVRFSRDVANITMDLNGDRGRSTSTPWAGPTPSPSTT